MPSFEGICKISPPWNNQLCLGKHSQGGGRAGLQPAGRQGPGQDQGGGDAGQGG